SIPSARSRSSLLGGTGGQLLVPARYAPRTSKSGPLSRSANSMAAPIVGGGVRAIAGGLAGPKLLEGQRLIRRTDPGNLVAQPVRGGALHDRAARQHENSQEHTKPASDLPPEMPAVPPRPPRHPIHGASGAVMSQATRWCGGGEGSH